MSALLPLLLICAPVVFLIIDGMMAPKTSSYVGNLTYRTDEVRAVPTYQPTSIEPLGSPA